MKGFMQAFGGLIGVALIGIALVGVMMLADWLMVKRRGRTHAEDDEAQP